MLQRCPALNVQLLQGVAMREVFSGSRALDFLSWHSEATQPMLPLPLAFSPNTLGEDGGGGGYLEALEALETTLCFKHFLGLGEFDHRGFAFGVILKVGRIGKPGEA